MQLGLEEVKFRMRFILRDWECVPWKCARGLLKSVKKIKQVEEGWI